MRKIYLIIGLLITMSIQAQNFGTDQEGYSTIYTEGASLSFNVVDNQLNLSYFKATPWDPVPVKDGNTISKVTFWGGSIRGNANDGITNLFSEGSINAEASMDFVVGIKTYKYQDYMTEKVEEINAEKTRLYDRGFKLKSNYLSFLYNLRKKYMLYMFQVLKKVPSLDTTIIESLENEISVHNIKWDWKQIEKDIKALNNDFGNELLKGIKAFDNNKKGSIVYYIDAVDNKKPFFDKTIWDEVFSKLIKVPKIAEVSDYSTYWKILNSLLQEMLINKETFDRHQKQKEEILNEAKRSKSSAWFMKYGLSKQEFKYDLDNGTNTFEQRLLNQEFTGLSFDFIYNYRWKHDNFLGVSLRAEQANNFAALESEEISFTDANGVVETYNAFTGNYNVFQRYSINMDYMHFHALESEGEDSIYLSINPYIRHFMYDNARNLKSNTNVGVGLNLFNSSQNKLLGGAFIQANDVFGVNTKQALGKSIAFGLVLRYAFEGFGFKKIK